MNLKINLTPKSKVKKVAQSKSKSQEPKKKMDLKLKKELKSDSKGQEPYVRTKEAEENIIAVFSAVQDKSKFKTPEELGAPLAYDLYKHGLTQSKIVNFRNCERKFRLDCMGFSTMSESQALIYGSVFHEALDKAQNLIKAGEVTASSDFNYDDILDAVEDHFEEDYLKSSPEGKNFYELAYSWAQVTLPVYFKYWEGDFFGDTKLEFVEIEKEFKVMVKGYDALPAIPLRGKRDGLVRIDGKLWLLENKTKGQWNEAVLSQIVERDLQNNTYIMAVEEEYKGEAIEGVIYNVIRRPQLRKGAKETMGVYVKRCADDILTRPEHYFLRLAVKIDRPTRNRFRFQMQRTLKLIQDWYGDHFKDPKEDIENTAECQGTYGSCKFLNMCCSHLEDCTGLYIKDKQFPELEEANKE